MTVPGVGPSTALRFVAAADVVARFASAHKVEAGTPVDLGETLDLGKLSPDGTLVALLRSRSQCSQFSCADLVVLPARVNNVLRNDN